MRELYDETQKKLWLKLRGSEQLDTTVRKAISIFNTVLRDRVPVLQLVALPPLENLFPDVWLSPPREPFVSLIAADVPGCHTRGRGSSLYGYEPPRRVQLHLARI